MKKIILTLLGISLLVQAADLQFSYHFAQPRIENGKLLLAGCDRIMQPFVPDLPVKAVRLLLPDGYTAQNVEITYGESRQTVLNAEIAPYSPSGRLSVAIPAGLKNQKSAIYQQDKFFPEQNKSVKYSVQYKNGHPVLFAVINPVQYNPVSRNLRFSADISLNINLIKDDSGYKMQKSDFSVQRQIAALVDNPELCNGWQKTEFDSTYYDYLIITPADYQSQFADFKDFNTRRCLKTRLKTVESINSETSGTDLQSKIRNYIKQEYLQKKISYVLLAGDDELIPHRGFRSQIMDYGTDYYDEKDIPADMYYSCLDGSWQNNGSLYFGEPGSEDLLSEVSTARLAVDSQTELSNLLNKIISYGENPVVAGVKKNLLVGELLWEEGDAPNFVDTYGKFYMDEFLGTSTHNSYTTGGFDFSWVTSTKYDYDATWSGSQLIQKINTDKPVWIDHLGHSNVTYNMKLNANQISASTFNSTGTAANYFFVYSQGCYSGSFDNRNSDGSVNYSDCIGEKFTTLSNAAFGYIGNSRYGLGSPYNTDGSGQRFHRYFHHALFAENLHALQEMNSYSKEINAPFILEQNINNPPYYGQCRWIAYCVNLFGDPALSLWSAAPDSLHPDFPAVATLGMTQANAIKTKPYARIGFAKQGEPLFFTTVADSSGLSDILNDINFAMSCPVGIGDSLMVYIKADNYYPFTGRILLEGDGIDADGLMRNLNLSAYPNPFNSQTVIKYDLPKEGNVTISVYNPKGELVASLLNNNQTAGMHSINWNAAGMQSGLYVVTLKSNNHIRHQKILMVK